MYDNVPEVTSEDFILMPPDESLRFVPRAAKFPGANKSRGGWILVYAPWCGHCRNPEWQAKYGALSDWLKRRNLHCYVLDATKNNRWVDEMEIPGFPFLFVYDQNGDVYAYEGPRELRDMVETMVDTLLNVNANANTS